MTIYHNIQHNIQPAISHFKKRIIETEIDEEESQSKEQIVVQC